ncbi:MAG: toprim domain-containing protein [Acidiferrobacterales bacterium]
MSYLEKRGVSMEDIVRMKLGYCEEGDYKNRIVFPSFDEHGDLNFFVGRSIFERGMMKYKTEDSYNKDIIFNDYLLDWRKPIVLTEGPFDALKAGANAIPIQGVGCRPRTKLFHKIVETGVDVYFAMDADAVRKQLKLIETFMDYDVHSFSVPLGNRKDVGEMTHAEFLEQRSKAKEIRSDLDLLRMRVRA